VVDVAASLCADVVVAVDRTTTAQSPTEMSEQRRSHRIVRRVTKKIYNALPSTPWTRVENGAVHTSEALEIDALLRFDDDPLGDCETGPRNGNRCT
jgi:hypothetical protein